jgi:hypothetical protein
MYIISKTDYVYISHLKVSNTEQPRAVLPWVKQRLAYGSAGTERIACVMFCQHKLTSSGSQDTLKRGRRKRVKAKLV